MPDPDLNAVALADAHRLGGAKLVDEACADALAVADEVAPLGSGGHVPDERESVWAAAVWTLVDAARAELVGTVVPTATGGAWTVTPARCPSGHPSQPGRVLVGWRPCRCGGHPTWTCTVMIAPERECAAETVAPEPVEGCRGVRAW